jgi:hypothetical protein
MCKVDSKEGKTKISSLDEARDEFEARSTKLQWDNNSLEHVVKEQDVEILNFK